jgi:hypothetical protein
VIGLALDLASKTSSSLLDQPGTLGFLVVFGMGVVLYFVFRSMAKHLRKVNDMAKADAEANAVADQPGAAAVAADQPNSDRHSADRT